MAEPKLIKIDRNGSKHYEGRVQCDRCGGGGIYYVGVHNGRPVPASPFHGTCYKCGGAGWVIDTWIERTPEYQAKLDAKREAKAAAKRAEQEAKQAKIEEERRRREAEIAALKAVSQHVGVPGQRMTIKCTYDGSGSFERKGFRTGWLAGCAETVFVHRFVDDAGNKLVWMTTSNIPQEIATGDKLTMVCTVKEHNVYKDEKQTQVQRCKFI